MSSYVNFLGGRCPHMPFFIGGTCPGGGGGECPTLIRYTYIYLQQASMLQDTLT